MKYPNRVLCCFCQWSFALSNMGKQALESHVNSNEHKKNVPTKVPSISSYFKKSTAPSKICVPNFGDNDTNTQASCATATEASRFSERHDGLKAEILWPLKAIESHLSYNSSKNIVGLLFSKYCWFYDSR